MSNALNVSLPKWPQMFVTGKPVTVEQAKDILFATDTFLTSLFQRGGNNHEWEKNVRNIAGIKDLTFKDIIEKYPYPGWDGDKERPDPHREIRSKLMRRTWLIPNEWDQVSGALQTEYVKNDWASCSFIGGPHGWCSPEGRIYYADNIGKYPSAEEVYNEWKAIAERWPFLDLAVTLMDAESCEDRNPVITFVVKNGEVTIIQDQTNWERYHHADEKNLEPQERWARMAHSRDYEQGMPQEWVDEYAMKVNTWWIENRQRIEEEIENG